MSIRRQAGMRRFLLPGFAVVCWLAWMLGAVSARAEELVIPGSGEPQQLLRALATLAASARPGFAVSVPESVGTGGGLKAVLEGQASLARIARPLKSKEEAAGLRQEFFATCPVVFAASVPEAWKPGLTPDQALAVYQGRITDWSAISEGRGKIYPLTREPGDSLLAAVDQGVPGFATAPAPAAKVTYTTPETLALLTGHPNALGYAAMPAFYGSGLAILPLAGVAPSAETLRSRAYPLTAPLGLAWKGDPSPETRAFLDFLRTPGAKAVIRDHGCLSAGE
jgi:phosphate transport system substrate-binding protein